MSSCQRRTYERNAVLAEEGCRFGRLAITIGAALIAGTGCARTATFVRAEPPPVPDSAAEAVTTTPTPAANLDRDLGEDGIDSRGLAAGKDDGGTNDVRDASWAIASVSATPPRNGPSPSADLRESVPLNGCLAFGRAPRPLHASRSFDNRAAVAALVAVAINVDTCKTVGGPIGVGIVSVVFAPSGETTLAVVDQPPFGGTPTGTCVAKRFRRVRVPKYEGDPVPATVPFRIR